MTFPLRIKHYPVTYLLFQVLPFTGAGSTQYIEITNDGTLDTKYSITVTMNLYPDATGRDGRIFTYGDSGDGVYLMQTEPFGLSWRLIRRDFALGVNELVVAPNVLVPEQWNHVVATYDYLSGWASILVNGLLATQMNVGSRVLATQEKIWVGGVSGDDRSYVGLMSCLQIYNKALSLEEARALHPINGGCPVRE